MATPDWLMRYRERRRSKAIKLLGGRCVHCGSTDELQFDHIQREGKIGNIATMIRASSWDDIVAELHKCQLLCKPCHEKKNGDETRLSTHGRLRMYRRGCRCVECKAKFSSLNRIYKKTYSDKHKDGMPPKL